MAKQMPYKGNEGIFQEAKRRVENFANSIGGRLPLPPLYILPPQKQLDTPGARV